MKKGYEIPLIFFSGLLLLLIASCNKEIGVDEYIIYMNESKDLNKEIEQKGLSISSSYKSSELLALTELRKAAKNKSAISKDIFKTEREKFSNAVYFDLTMGLKNRENIMTRGLADQTQYAAMLGELTYNMGEHVYVVTDTKDTLRSITYNFSNTYGMSPDIKFLFAFPARLLEGSYNSFEIVYNDRLFGLNKKVSFQYKVADLKKHPHIKDLE